MGNSYYEIDCIDQELEIYTVMKKSSGTIYYITKNEENNHWIHECKARSVYGDTFICRHIRMVIQKFYTNKPHKALFNISPKRNNSKAKDGKSADSKTG